MGLVDAARERYLGWLGSYGLPDHPLLRAASDRLRATTTSISGAEAVARARAALAVGDAPAALADLALAFRTLPSALFEREAAADFARLAAQAPDLSVTSARAAGLAEQADAALAEHRLADALGAYRAAVVTAPWSADLHRNLAALLAEASRFDDAVLEMDWYLRLAPAGPAVAQARRARASWAASPEEREQRRQVRERRYLGRWRAANSRRSAGIALSVIGGILGGAGGGLFAGLGARTNDQIRAGGFSTGQDLDAVHSLGHRYNQTAVGFAIAGAAITAVGLPLALSSLYVGDADAPEAP